MNQVQLVGNITRDPDYKTLQSGVTCCQFTVACQRRFANQQGVREADFINCVAWRQTADFVHKYFLKGQKIGVIGTLQTRSYDAQDGTKRYVTEVLVDNVEFVAPRSNGSGQATQPGQYSQSEGGQTNRNGSIPGIMQPPSNQQQRMNLNQQSDNGFTEVEDDELPF